MNRIHRLVWNCALGTVQVVSEVSRTTKGKMTAGSPPAMHRVRPLAFACSIALGVLALSAPLGAHADGGRGGDSSLFMEAAGAGGTIAHPVGFAGQFVITPGGYSEPGGGGGGGADYLSGNQVGQGAAGGVGGYGGAGGHGSFVGFNARTSTALASYVGADGGRGIYPTLKLNGYSDGGGGGGGAGAFAVISSAVNVTLAAGLTLTGGNGGIGGVADTSVGLGGGGGGGQGGGGLLLQRSGGTFTNSGTVTGGKAGSGASGGGSGGQGGSGGTGGVGVLFNGATAGRVVNDGSINGGAGNGGTAGGINSPQGIDGPGGAGILSTGGLFVINAGHIAAGLSGSSYLPPTLADAVDFSGGGNTLELDAGNSIVGKVVSTSASTNGGDTLALGGATNANFDASQLGAPGSAAQYQGFAKFAKTGTSNWTLDGVAASRSPWLISAGTLTLGSTGSLAAASVTDNAIFNVSATSSNPSIVSLGGNGRVILGAHALTLSQAADTFSGVISGGGGLTVSAGTEILTGVNTYTGATSVQGGTLLVGNGGNTTAAVEGNVGVASGAVLGGTGTIHGAVTIASGAHLDPGAGGTIGTLGVGNLTVAKGGILDFTFGARGASATTFGTGDGVTVANSLVLNGATLNVNAKPDFGPGLYRLFSYGGSLTETNGGLALGTTPAGHTVSIQTLTGDKQINLISCACNHQLVFWNANGQASATQLGGGSGAWSTTAPNWTNAAATVSGPMTPQPGFAVFGGAAGTVTVNNAAGAVRATGMQFASTGYVMSGNPLTLVAGNNAAAPVIRVGDGTTDSTGYVATVNNVLLGTNGLVKSDYGTLVLTATNTYTGGTSIARGTLQLGNGGTIGSIAGNIVDNGTLAINRSNNVGFTALVSGTGGLVKSGTGDLTLLNANTYSGGTAINAGTLVLDRPSSIGSGTLALAAGTTLNITRSLTLANAVTLSGDPTVNVGSGLSTTLGGGISDGTQAGDLVKTGAGALVLSGADTYTGRTEAAAGTLDVRGSLASAVSVDSGATLAGTGSIGGLTVASGGAVSPGGNGIGILTVNGNVNLLPGSTYRVDANSTGSSDVIRATGAAEVDQSSVVSVAAGSNWSPRSRYTILGAAGGVGGKIASVSTNLAFLDPILTYDAYTIYLNLVRNDIAFATVAATPNEVHVANATQALAADQAVYGAVLPLAIEPARTAFDNLAGDVLASTRTAIIDDSHYVRDAINAHLQGVQGAGQIAQNDENGSAWASTWGHGGDHDADANAARLSSTGSGVLVGADRNLGTFRLGAVAGAGQLSNNGTGASADAHSTDTVFGLYSGLDLGAWQLQGGAAHSWYQTHSHRLIDVPTLEGFSTASTSYGVTQAYIDGGYQFKFAKSSLTPYVDLARVWVHQDAINEGGSATALAVQANGTAVNYGTVGLRGIFEPAPGLQLHANVGYQQTWGDLRSIDQQRFINGGVGSFTVAGLPVSKSSGIADLGIRFALSSNVSVDGTYHGQFARDATDQGARLSLNVAF